MKTENYGTLQRRLASQLFKTILYTFILFAFFGIVYPIIIFFLGEMFFKDKSNGSLISKNGQIVGSRLIGQQFSSAKYFHGRPSAAGSGYDAANSSASNLAPTNQKLINGMSEQIKNLLNENPGLSQNNIPIDMITSSASGLDPDISVHGALIQVKRIATERQITEEKIESLIYELAKNPYFGFMGTKTVNVLELNLKLDSF